MCVCVPIGYTTPKMAIVKYPKEDQKSLTNTTKKREKKSIKVFYCSLEFPHLIYTVYMIPSTLDTIIQAHFRITTVDEMAFRPMKTNKSSLIDQNDSILGSILAS